MRVFDIQSMIDSLYRLTHPATELSDAFQRIPLATNPGLCLEISGGNPARGTPMRLWTCNGTAAQQLVYDRRAQTIKSAAFGWCLGVSGGNPTPGAPVITWDCDGTDSQRWSYDPESKVIRNALGNVLDVEWGNLSEGTPVWTWPVNYSAAQLWRANRDCNKMCFASCTVGCANTGPDFG